MRIPFTTSVVKVKLDKLIPPVSINNESEVAEPAVAILALDAKVIAPDHVLFPLGFLMAPCVVAIPSP